MFVTLVATVGFFSFLSLQGSAADSAGQISFLVQDGKSTPGYVATVSAGQLIEKDMTKKKKFKLNQSVFDFAISPDNKKIALLVSPKKGGTDLYVADRSGANIQRIKHFQDTAIFDLTWSPDNNKIAFSYGISDNQNVFSNDYTFDLYTINPDGSQLTRITQTATDEYQPAWSPDGQKIVYVQSEHTSPEPTASNSTSQAMSVHTIDVNTQQDSNLFVSQNSAEEIHFPAWSPDGTMIAFSTTNYGVKPSAAHSWISVMNQDGSDQKKVAEKHAAITTALAWSPDGKNLIFSRVRAGQIMNDLYLFHFQDGLIKQLTHTPRLSENLPAWR